MITRTVTQLEAELESLKASYAEELGLAELLGNEAEVRAIWEATIASHEALIEARKAQDNAPCDMPYGVHIPRAYSGSKSELEGSDMWA